MLHLVCMPARTIPQPQAQFGRSRRGCLLPISLLTTEPDADADVGSEMPTPVVSVLDQVLALMQGLEAEDLAKIQSAATQRIEHLAQVWIKVA